MAESWTTTELLADIRQQGRIPEDDPDATDAALLSEADHQLKTIFVPAIRKARADWYSAFEDQALVAGQSAYRIPHRAATSSVRTVLWYDSAGNRFECFPVPMTDQHGSATRRGRPAYYAIEDDRVRLIPAPSSAMGTLRIYYERRPSTLVVEDDALQVSTSVDTDLDEYYVTTGTANPASLFSAGDKVDLIKADPPFSACFTGKAITSIAGPIATIYIITLAYDDVTMQLGSGTGPTDLTDWLCQTGETVIPQIPPELHPLLALATAAQYLRPIDPDAYNTAMNDFTARFTEAVKLLSPRQQGRQQKMRGGSMLRRSSSRRGGTFDDFG